jgi:hypothetical protein
VLHLTPQTISSQLKVLEDSLGVRLFARSGRNLVLTDAGRLALSFAEEIFRLGTEMSEALKGRSSGRPLQLSALRGALMYWLDRLSIRPHIVGEFEDRALMQAFGQSGVGVFMSPSVIDAEIAQQHGVEAIGSTTEVRERY